MLGREAISLRAFPIGRYPEEVIERHGDNLLADLAGNAFTGTVVLAIISAAMQVLPWVSAASSAAEDELASSADDTRADDQLPSLAASIASVTDHLVSLCSPEAI